MIRTDYPVAVIGAGPVGLAAAAHLIERGLEPLVLEAGAAVGSSIRAWGHVRLFSTWRYNLDRASVRLLERHGWQAPRPTALPYGSQIVEDYLEPLAATPELAGRIRTGHRVVAVARKDHDKGSSIGREEAPFLLRVQGPDGALTEILARAVIDASGTWEARAPLGSSGLPALGEPEAAAAGLVTAPLADVTASDAASGGFAGRRTLVVGGGHSAANSVLALAQLARTNPGTEVVWAIRAEVPDRAYGGGPADELPARGQLGTRLHTMVDSGAAQLVTGFRTARIEILDGQRLRVHAEDGRTIDADRLIPATGFRPDLSILSEVRLDLDPAVDAPRKLGPLIDPDFHSCGTVAPHGAKVLAHPEKDLYIAGMKSYGRAPTFLMATGYEQVRSIAAELAGDRADADTVRLELPATGVCSGAGSDGTADEALLGGSCCGTAPAPVTIGFPTGLRHGRAGEAVTAAQT
ncbi:flavoprotein [Sinomonas cellulolyticus]|uniref:NAD(P)-binding domain-containing protein n=1 Tax=Sinomonas cellulolyticus TaxID=2801916 RepID=A0ABS1K5R6_9MICC|nr:MULTISPECIES: FAD-dependent oxidoreductase [Sinomonas]MBL0706883.1 NAD(P)-binding domain-containing protein [Sinomonas cellulolyticus]GHG52978.1 flavoprotein [Sinomonas sp. KCTC 49339]